MKSAATIAAAAALLVVAPAVAQTGGYYTAVPKAALAKTSFITRSALWKCSDGVCAASKVSERAAILCEVVARQVGPLTAFSVGGAAYGEDALAKCNAKAR